MAGFFSTATQDIPPAPQIDMDKHFSDVKDRFYIRYNRNRPKQIRSLLKTEHSKLRDQIEAEFLHSMFPHKEIVESELKAHLSMIVDVFTRHDGAFDGGELAAIDLAHSHVARIAKDHSVVLPPRYFSTLAGTYATIDAVDKAVATIDNGLSGGSDDAILLSEKAYILRSAGRVDDALTALEAAIKITPKAEFLWHNKGITLEKLGRTDDAVQCYKKALSLDSNCADLHYHYGITLYEKDDFKAAYNEFDKAFQLRHNDSKFLLWKARTLASLDKAEEARQIVETILADDPTNADAWFVLGHIREDDASALLCFQKAVKLDPKHGGALCSSAACLSNLGKLDEALDIFSEIGELCTLHKSCSTLVLNICTTLGKLDRPKDGLAACEKILIKDPDNLGALHAKACSLARLGKHAAAQKIFTNLVVIRPQDSELLYNQACAYALAKKPREAVKSLQSATALDAKWWESAKHDPDLTPVRRTKIYREAVAAACRAPMHKTMKNKVSKKSGIRPTGVSRTTK